MGSKNIFIAFTGPKIEQESSIHHIAPGYECWNLTKFVLEGFVSAIKGRIPPINTNVLRNYERKPGEADDPFGIRDEQYKICSWGLLLPDRVPDALGNGYADIVFLLSLYSPRFLYPVFYVTDFGISQPNHHKSHLLYHHDQNQADRFKKEQFVKFYETLTPESVYGSWQADRLARWDKEDWRLFVACLLFTELKRNEYSKEVFTWQRESADMATILEALFTAGTDDSTEVGYKLRKRIAALMGFRFTDIEQEIKELYKQRSAFVHGSFFLQAKRSIEIQRGFAKLPSPPFEFLYKQKEYIRHALVAYLYVSKIFRSDRNVFENSENMLDILEKSVIDLDLRAKVKQLASEIFSLM
jgi:hypothetical protein